MTRSSPPAANDPTAPLRERVRQIEQPTTLAHGVLPFGLAKIDRTLPGGGLARGALHEIFGAGGDEEDGALAAAFAAAILARLGPLPDPPPLAGEGMGGGIVLWCLPRPDLYGPGLAVCGMDPARLVLVRAARDAEILWAMEEGLRTAGITAVVGEIGGLPDVAGRRLQLAAERSGVTALVLRRWRNAAAAARERARPSAAATRWRIAALPSRPIPISPPIHALHPVIRHLRASGDRGVTSSAFPAVSPRFLGGDGTGGTEPGVGHPRWRVELLRCRGGETAAWTIELRHGTMVDATDPLSLAPALADRPAPSARPPQFRRAG